MISRRILFTLIVLVLLNLTALAQSSGARTLRGTVTLGNTGKPVHNVMITVLQLKRTVTTDDDGKYEITDLPPGKYDIVAHLDRVPEVVRSADLTTAEATVDFQMELSSLREEVTITATGTEQAVSTSIQSVDVCWGRSTSRRRVLFHSAKLSTANWESQSGVSDRGPHGQCCEDSTEIAC